jgi:hypothetical protein
VALRSRPDWPGAQPRHTLHSPAPSTVNQLIKKKDNANLLVARVECEHGVLGVAHNDQLLSEIVDIQRLQYIVQQVSSPATNPLLFTLMSAKAIVASVVYSPSASKAKIYTATDETRNVTARSSPATSNKLNAVNCVRSELETMKRTKNKTKTKKYAPFRWFRLRFQRHLAGASAAS